ncbi:MAG: phosphatidylserine decarboxylase [Candidatus Magnetoovum sp. WYHC-5]|nr:phosphatidylserine decarboxylase [Candidatus Magnetoovum sp. WYHC-5]
MKNYPHQYIDRESGKIVDESMFADFTVNVLYGAIKENAPAIFSALTGRQFSKAIGFLNYKHVLSARLTGGLEFLKALGVDFSECLEPVQNLSTPAKVFERQIRYWQRRPMPKEPWTVTSPSDSRVLFGSLCGHSEILIKGKFFNYDELFGIDKPQWLKAFKGGDFMVFRLTPDKYHYNHNPVSGQVIDFYEIEGKYHSCNPCAIIKTITPFSKNRRSVTIIDTDVEGGTKVGFVAFIEIAALMIGDIVQCYSEHRYENPQGMMPGMFLKKGNPKSLFRPGASTNIVFFQRDKIHFAEDILLNMRNPYAKSRYCASFNLPIVETDVKVRSLVAVAK